MSDAFNLLIVKIFSKIVFSLLVKLELSCPFLELSSIAP